MTAGSLVKASPVWKHLRAEQADTIKARTKTPLIAFIVMKVVSAVEKYNKEEEVLQMVLVMEKLNVEEKDREVLVLYSVEPSRFEGYQSRTRPDIRRLYGGH